MTERITEYHGSTPTIPHNRLPEACRKLAELEDMDEQNRLYVLPVAIGGLVYEIVTDERTEPYIAEYEVTDVSVRGVEYEGDWVNWNYCNLYTDYREAELALVKLKEMETMFNG